MRRQRPSRRETRQQPRPRLNAAADARGGVSLQQVQSCCIACSLTRTPLSWKAARAVPGHWQKKVATRKTESGPLDAHRRYSPRSPAYSAAAAYRPARPPKPTPEPRLPPFPPVGAPVLSSRWRRSSTPRKSRWPYEPRRLRLRRKDVLCPSLMVSYVLLSWTAMAFSGSQITAPYTARRMANTAKMAPCNHRNVRL
jgi:hypothetical protein